VPEAPLLSVGIDPSGAVAGGKRATDAINKVGAAAQGLGAQLSKVAKLYMSFLSLRAVLRVAESFLDAAARAETYRQRLRAVVKETENADELYARIAKWAAINPIDTDEAIESFVLLRAAAVQNSEEALHVIADLSAVAGRSMQDTTAALVSTETESLRRFGILVDRSGQMAVVRSGEVRKVVAKDIDSVRQAILDVVRENYAGAMAAQAGTWAGLVQTMEGMWNEFKIAVADSGPFNAVRSILARLIREWDAWTKSDDYKKFVSEVGASVTRALQMLERLGGGIAEVFAFAAKHVEAVLAGIEGIIAALVARGGMKLIGLAGLLGGPVAAGVAVGVGTLATLDAAFGKTETAASKAQDEIVALAAQLEALRAQGATETSWGVNTEALDAQIQALEQEISLKKAAFHYMMDMESKRVDNPPTTGNPPTLKGASGGEPLAPITSGSSGPSAAERLVSAIRDKMKYLYEDGKSFLPVLDQWAAKLAPLTDDWKTVVDLQREITAEGAKAASESVAAEMERAEAVRQQVQDAQNAAKEGRERFWSGASWENAQGLLPDPQYLELLQGAFDRLSASIAAMGLDAKNSFNWSEEMRGRFGEIQSVAERISSMSMEHLSSQLDNGTISADAYRSALEQLLTQWSAYPLVVQNVRSELQALDTTLAATANNIYLMAAEAQRALTEKLADVPSSLADAFAGAVVNCDNLGDALQNLAKEIAYLAIRAMFLKTIGGLFGNLFGNLFGGISSVGGVAANIGGVIGSGLSAATSSLGGTNSGPLWRPPAESIRRNPDGRSTMREPEESVAGKSIAITINAVDAPSFVSLLKNNRAAVEGIVSDNILRNGAVRRAMQGA